MEGLTMKIKRNKLPSVEIINELFTLDAETGILYYNVRDEKHFKRPAWCSSWNKRYANTSAKLCLNRKDGYRTVRIDGINYPQHRVIMKMINGVDPDFVDHINGDRQDNRVCNLRSVAYVDNYKNMSKSSRNKSGYIGVNYRKDDNTWEGRVTINYKDIERKRFKTKEEAIAHVAYLHKKYNFHPNHGRERTAQ
jgi:hypothetical protein